jgi:hypothetical protein
VSLSLRIKLWIGWLFGWDKQGVRAMLLIIGFWIAFIAFAFVYDGVIRPVIFPEPQGIMTPAQEQEFLDWFERQKEIRENRR